MTTRRAFFASAHAAIAAAVVAAPLVAESAPEPPTSELPDRGSASPDSPFYLGALARHTVVTLNGHETRNVVEYCVSERWVDVLVVERIGPRDRTCPRVRHRGTVAVVLRPSRGTASGTG